MKRALLTAILLLSLACGGGSARADAGQVRVLFIGNSLTAANDLPSVVASLAREDCLLPAP